jgi:hypothetical protein
MNAQLTADQVRVLLAPIKPGRVAHREGLSNMEGYDIRAHLTRLFGFGRWDDVAVAPTTMLYEQPTTTKAGKDAFKVAYRAERALIIRDQQGNHLCTYHGSAVGESTMPDFKRGDAHDMAIKTAETQALKRAAVNLGDQFGLSLYAKGATGALVGKVVGFDPDAGAHVELHEPDVVEEVDPDTGPEHDDVVAHDAGEARYEGHVPTPGFDRKTIGTVHEQAPDAEPHDGVQLAIAVPGEDPVPGTEVPNALERPEMISNAQIKKMQTLFGQLGIRERAAKITYINNMLGLDVASSKDLTKDQASKLIDEMERLASL